MMYNKQQQMLAFSFMSALGFYLTGTDKRNATKILNMLNKALATWAPVKDQWDVVWGPSIIVIPGTKYDNNLMFVVQSKIDPSEYTVVIRGTNPISVIDFYVWDGQIEEKKDWMFGSPPKGLKPKISESTTFGLISLQGMRPGLGLPGEKLTLQEFLLKEAIKHKTMNVTITGHSLGGTLASTSTLWLKDIQEAGKLPSNINFSAVAFAGATAGDEDFATYSNARLGDSCTRIANTLDIVPYFSATEEIKKLFTLYGPLKLPNPTMAYLLFVMSRLSNGKGYKQIDLNSKLLVGSRNKWAITYMAQVVYQHVHAYPLLMGMTAKDIPVNKLFPLRKVIKSLIGFK